MPSKKPLFDYSFVDAQKLDEYLQQVGETDVVEPKRESKVALSLTPSIEFSTSREARPKTTHEKVVDFTTYLLREGLVLLERPQVSPSWGDQPVPFVMEEMDAVKIMLPTTSALRDKGVKSFAVWVSDPDTKRLSQTGWDFPGSFLYLTELVFDDVVFGSVFSGCSALQFIANAASGVPLLTRTGPEPLGRGSHNHPLEKFRSIGGVIGDRRRILSLYRLRYMTNEQCYTHDGKQYRLNDIVGYPIYIATKLA